MGGRPVCCRKAHVPPTPTVTLVWVGFVLVPTQIPGSGVAGGASVFNLPLPTPMVGVLLSDTVAVL